MPGESSERKLPHIFVKKKATAEDYRRPQAGGGSKRPPTPLAHAAHGKRLDVALVTAIQQADKLRAAAGLPVEGARTGVYVTLEAPPNQPVLSAALVSKAKNDPKVELLNVTEVNNVQRATVALSEKGEVALRKKLTEYASSPREKPKHADLVNRISSLRLARLRDLWTDPSPFPANGPAIWWEVWLRRYDGKEAERFRALAKAAELLVARRELRFPDRVVLQCRGSPEGLARAADATTDFAEVRLARETAHAVTALSNLDQADLLGDLEKRLVAADAKAAFVCLLDTGVNRGHPLLRASLAEADMHTVEPEWTKADKHGHGTEQAGIALYGDLLGALQTNQPVPLAHRLESVKILTGDPWAAHGAVPPTYHGAVTADAVAQVESIDPDRRRAFCLATTLTGPSTLGRPSSWSSAVDALAAGRSFLPTDEGLQYIDDPADDQPRRLFVLSAGDVQEDSWSKDHLDASDAMVVEDPGHAWNALTVGAMTELGDPGEDHPGWSPVAPPGELSPFSCASVGFDREWPSKPDIVIEGGNLAISADGKMLTPTDALTLLTTYKVPLVRLFKTTWGTSPAAAQVARMAAQVASQHSDLWPETIRALIVHSARWTPAMQGAFRAARRRVLDKENFLRRYGYGVPSLERALYSARNDLTLVVQDTIHPFAKGKMKEMHIHELPWPAQKLEELEEADVKLRVTLSYFVEPNPRSPGWARRERYASHGLRFDLCRPSETPDGFRKRINQLALEPEEENPENRQEKGWVLGSFAREKGSLHSDVWVGTARELASRSYLAVFPVSGWWKEQPHRDRSALGARYGLTVSIEAPEVEVDIWTPVASLVGIVV